MSYQVLARKWRPQVFEDVVGQEHITDVLINSLETGRIHHGYLFSGIRGIGKTTTARILAKALNCVHGPTPHPCNQCEFCKEITEGYSMDVEEIDGASNRGVDEVRILQENASYAPTRSRYKVFIIDEVHMLTSPAFNALLKTLEEPPPNVVFIMATTEPWKIPMTILSRCQQFKFKNSTSSQLIALLKKLTQHEQIAINDDSLALIAKSARGSVRDAENLLDQVIGFCGNYVCEEDVRYVLGIPDQGLLHAFLSAIFAHQTAQIFALMEQLVSQGYNLRFFCMELMDRIRNLIVLKVVPQPERYLSLVDYTRADLDCYVDQTTLSELQQVYWLLAEVESDIKFSPNPRFILEMALANMADVQTLEPIEGLYVQLQELKAALENRYPEEIDENLVMTSEESDKRIGRSSCSYQELLWLWDETLKTIKQQRPSFAARLKNAIPVQLTQDELTLGFHQEAEFSKKSLQNPKNIALLTKVLREHLDRSVQIVITTHNEAVSVEAMRKKLDQHIVSTPRSESKPQKIKNTSADQDFRSKRNRQKRPNSPGSYKPLVQVTVQDIVRIFEGRIEK